MAKIEIKNNKKTKQNKKTYEDYDVISDILKKFKQFRIIMIFFFQVNQKIYDICHLDIKTSKKKKVCLVNKFLSKKNL